MNTHQLIILLLLRLKGEDMFELKIDEVEWTDPAYSHQN